MKVILTGATGMVGEGVLHECLQHPDVENVLLVNRRSSGVMHPKVKEIVHNDFFNFEAIHEQLQGYDACFFCLGVSAIGMKEEEYHRVTYDLTMSFARTLLAGNPSMTFCYISGAGTDSSEKGSSMWARVKGKTENALMNLGFRNAYAFRPGFMKPTPEMKNTLSFYKYVNWLFPILRRVTPGHVSTLAELGRGMINTVKYQPQKKVLEVRDFVPLAHQDATKLG